LEVMPGIIALNPRCGKWFLVQSGKAARS
jgi:hypothetical protein